LVYKVIEKILRSDLSGEVQILIDMIRKLEMFWRYCHNSINLSEIKIKIINTRAFQRV